MQPELLGIFGQRIFTFAAGGVDFNTNPSWPGPTQGYIDLILGIDLYPNVQPNNGTCSVYMSVPTPPAGNRTIFQVQQSANFPGPFFWRGLSPVLYTVNFVAVESTVPFNYAVWGVQVPDYNMDG